MGHLTRAEALAKKEIAEVVKNTGWMLYGTERNPFLEKKCIKLHQQRN